MRLNDSRAATVRSVSGVAVMWQALLRQAAGVMRNALAVLGVALVAYTSVSGCLVTIPQGSRSCTLVDGFTA